MLHWDAELPFLVNPFPRHDYFLTSYSIRRRAINTLFILKKNKANSIFISNSARYYDSDVLSKPQKHDIRNVDVNYLTRLISCSL